VAGSNLVVNGASGTVGLLRYGQNGYVTFSGTAGQLLALQTTFVGRTVTLSVLKPDGSQLDSWGAASSPSTRNLPALPATGTYTIYVDPYHGDTGTYTLKVTTVGSGMAPAHRERLGEGGGGGRKVLGRVAAKAVAKAAPTRPAQQVGPTWPQLVAQLQVDGGVPANRYEVTKYYAFGGQRVATRQAGNEVFYLVGDQLGSASLVADWHGDKVSEVRYTPWGEARWAWELDGAGYTNRLFTSQLAQTRTYVGQLYDYGARFYSPVTGRFTSADSIVPQPGNPQSLNRYAYVYNNPLTNSDPSGHCAIQGSVMGWGFSIPIPGIFCPGEEPKSIPPMDHVGKRVNNDAAVDALSTRWAQQDVYRPTDTPTPPPTATSTPIVMDPADPTPTATPFATSNPKIKTSSDEIADQLADLRERSGLGPEKGTVAILMVDGQKYEGISGGNPPNPAGVNIVSFNHAEIDALNKLAAARQQSGKAGGIARMYIDNPKGPCSFCRRRDGIPREMRYARLDNLFVIDDSGKVWAFTPEP
jgi:RHS repeat-associated protein